MLLGPGCALLTQPGKSCLDILHGNLNGHFASVHPQELNSDTSGSPLFNTSHDRTWSLDHSMAESCFTIQTRNMAFHPFICLPSEQNPIGNRFNTAHLEHRQNYFQQILTNQTIGSAIPSCRIHWLEPHHVIQSPTESYFPFRAKPHSSR